MQDTKAKPFVLHLVEVAAGEKISFFRSVKSAKKEIKIYYTPSKIIFAHFAERKFEKIEARYRETRESLLGFEGMVMESIRMNSSNAPLLSQHRH